MTSQASNWLSEASLQERVEATKTIRSNVDELSLGDTTERDFIGVFGPFPATLEMKSVFRKAGLISHQFFALLSDLRFRCNEALSESEGRETTFERRALGQAIARPEKTYCSGYARPTSKHPNPGV